MDGIRIFFRDLCRFRHSLISLSSYITRLSVVNDTLFHMLCIELEVSDKIILDTTIFIDEHFYEYKNTNFRVYSFDVKSRIKIENTISLSNQHELLKLKMMYYFFRKFFCCLYLI